MAKSHRNGSRKAEKSTSTATRPSAAPAPAPEAEAPAFTPDAPVGTVRHPLGVHVLIRPGMYVEAEKGGESGCFEPGIVASVTPQGVFVRFDDGEVHGVGFDRLSVYAGGMDPGAAAVSNPASDLYLEEMDGLRVRFPHSPIHLRAYLCEASWFRNGSTLHVMLTPKQAEALGVAVVTNRGEEWGDVPGAENLEEAGYNLPACNSTATLPPPADPFDAIFREAVLLHERYERAIEAARAEHGDDFGPNEYDSKELQDAFYLVRDQCRMVSENFTIAKLTSNANA